MNRVNTGRKLIAILLSIAIVFAFMPGIESAYAADDETHQLYVKLVNYDGTIIYNYSYSDVTFLNEEGSKISEAKPGEKVKVVTTITSSNGGLYMLVIIGADGAELDSDDSFIMPSSDVTVSVQWKKLLTVTGAEVYNKTYDGTTDAYVDTDNVKVDGIYEEDESQFIGIKATGTFDNKNAGANKKVTVHYEALFEDDSIASKYIIADGIMRGNISRKALDISGTPVADKVYDGTVDADAAWGTLTGAVPGDDVYIDTDKSTAAFEDKNVGEGKIVNLTYEIAGADAANYTKPSGGQSTADITPKTISVKAKAKESYVGENLKSLTYEVTGLCGNDELTGELKTNAVKSTASKKLITQGTLSAGENYVIDYTSAYYTVKKVATKFIAKSTAYRTSMKYTWSKVDGAVKYKVYFVKCGWGNEPKLVKTTTGRSYTKTGLKKGTSYKGYVVAYDKNGNVLAKSPLVHAITKAGTRSNTAKLEAKTKLSISAGKSAKVSAKITGKTSTKPLLSEGHTAYIRYYSADKKVATVDSNGKVTGVKKGIAKIYSVAANGVYKVTTVTVK